MNDFYLPFSSCVQAGGVWPKDSPGNQTLLKNVPAWTRRVKRHRGGGNILKLFSYLDYWFGVFSLLNFHLRFVYLVYVGGLIYIGGF